MKTFVIHYTMPGAHIAKTAVFRAACFNDAYRCLAIGATVLPSSFVCF